MSRIGTLGWVPALSLLGCLGSPPPLPMLEESTGTTEGSSGDGDTTSPGSTASSSSGTSMSPDSSDGQSDTSPDSGTCTLRCMAVSDCGSPENFECNDGLCVYIGQPPPCDPTICDDLMLGVCTDVGGVSQCTVPCDSDSDCEALMQECTGTDDNGNKICVALPCFGFAEGELCESDGFGAVGTCIDGQCTCTSDDECTADDWACTTNP